MGVFAEIREKERAERERYAYLERQRKQIKDLEYRISNAEDMYLTTDFYTEEEYNREIEYLRKRIKEIEEEMRKQTKESQ